MSTKIYNGKKINKELINNIDKFSLLFSKLKEEALKELEKNIYKEIDLIIHRIIFNFLIENKVEEFIDSYLIDIIDRPKKDFDIENISFFDFIIESNIKNKISEYYFHRLFLYEANKKYLCSEVENEIKINYSKYKFKNYEYYNNTDKPESVTENEWSKRKKDWDIALSKNPLIVDIISDNEVLNVFKHVINVIRNKDLNKYIQNDVSLPIFEYLFTLKYNEDNNLKYTVYRKNFKNGMYKVEFENLCNLYMERKKTINLNIFKDFKISKKGEELCISK